MIDKFDDLLMLQEVKDFIQQNGADEFLKSFALFHPAEAKALTSAILEDHSHDYDKKKVALLKKVNV